MLKGGWTPEDLEHWIALRFRLKVSQDSLRTHQEQCQKSPPPGKDLVEVAEPNQGLVLYVQTPDESTTVGRQTRQPNQNHQE